MHVPNGPGGEIRVLLVDDVPDLRLLLRMELETDDRFEIVGEAGDGRQAVSMARELQPDIVILDVAMPIMDGLEAIPGIHDHSPDSRILILSGFDERVGEKAVSLSADAYKQKGDDLSLIRLAIIDVMEKPSKRIAEAG